MSVLKKVFVDFPAWLMPNVLGVPPVSGKATPRMIDSEPNGAYFIPGTRLPVYFVMHSDHTYSVANPQPHRPDPNNSKATLDTLKFLLSQAPMIDAPTDRFNAARAVTKYAYIHPTTLAKLATYTCTIKHGQPWITLAPSPTRWISTTLMPEGRVIYTPNAIPGLEKLLA